MFKPRILLFFLVILSLLLGTGSFFLKWWADKDAVKVKTVRIIEDKRHVYNLPLYIALEQGYFKEQKLKVDIITANNEEAVLPALFNNKADIALTGLEYAVYDHALGRGKPVAFAALTRRDSTLIMAREDMPDFKWSDLKGKSVITESPESRSCLVLESVLRQNDIAPYRQVSLFTNIPDYLRAGAFKSGTGTFLQVPEPLASELESQGVGKVVVSLGAVAGDYPALVCLATRDYLRVNADVLQRFTNAVYKAQLWLRHHDARESAMLMRKPLKDHNNDLVMKAIKRYQSQMTWIPSPVIEREKFNRFQDIMLEAGEIAERVEYSEVVETVFAEQAVQTVQYIPEEKRPKRSFPLNYYDDFREKFLEK